MIEVREHGAGRPTVVVLHGGPGAAGSASSLARELGSSFHVLEPWQRRRRQTPLGVARHVEDLRDLLTARAAEPPPVLVGHSWGAMVAPYAAARYPDRIRQLVLIDGGFGGGRRGGATWEEFKARLSPRDIYGPRERYLGALRRQLAECWSDQLEAMVMSMVRIDADGTVHERLEPANHEQVLWAMWQEPSSTVFSQLRCPTLLAPAGPRAGANPEFGARKREVVAAAAEAIADCRVEWIPETMHDIGYHKPDELAHVLRSFLASTDAV